MNIIQLQVMLHYFYNPTPYPNPGNSVEIDKAHAICMEYDLLEKMPLMYDERYQPYKYRVTEKGRVFVNALMSVPLPVVSYTMPKPTP